VQEETMLEAADDHDEETPVSWRRCSKCRAWVACPADKHGLGTCPTCRRRV